MMPGTLARILWCGCVVAFVALAGGNDAMLCREEPLIDTCTPGFECCDKLLNSPTAPLYAMLKERNDVDDILKGKLARFEPGGTAVGAHSVASLPFSVEHMTRWSGGVYQPTTLFMSLHVFRIFEIDQKAGKYKMQYTLKFRWRDCRLVHSCPPLGFDNQDPDYNSFWKPPVQVFETLHEEASVQYGSHTISANGTDDYFVGKISDFHCTFDFTDIPWDAQRCTLSFFFPSQTDYYMNIRWSELAVTSSPLSSQEWEVQQGSEWTREKPAEAKLTVKFVLTRKSGALVKNFVYPAIFFYIASWAGLWIDPRAVPARTMMSLMPVLITVNKYTQLSASMPSLGYATRLDQFLFTQIIILILHVIEFAVIHAAGLSLQHAEVAKEKADADDADGLESQAAKAGTLLGGARRCRLRVCAAVHRRLETHARWVSPLMYAATIAWLYQ